MKKLIWLVDISLDGFMSGPNGELDWAGANMDDELWEDVIQLLSIVDAALFGRITYQNFETYWTAVARNPDRPKNELDFSRWMDDTPKTVASKTLKRLDWKNSILLNNNIDESVLELKRQPGLNIVIFGSCSLASHLVNAGLIDEIRIRVHPVVLGVGRPLFKTAPGRHDLKLVKSTTFRSGVIGLRYNVA